ncbi:guanylate kinase-associated protein mars [Calliphora vicina]|uniref:guanylate kinase-associated protein mars n=1 Tax=Calliphora vicina TaxID=7373 RepID=UPI00325B10BC
MEHHINLYNDLRSQTPHHKRINRELREANRNKQRRDRFQNSRNISVSPVRHKQIIIPLCSDGKENEAEEENRNTTRLAKLVCNTNNPEKLTKQEEFLKRFVEWMDKKKNMKKEKEGTNKKKPFIAVVNSASKPAASTSLVPRGHHDGFRPPVLKNPIEKVKADATKAGVKGRPSIYTVVPTPPRKTKETDEKLKKKFPIARKALPTNLHTKILNSNKTPNVAATNLQTNHVSSNKTPNVAATSLTRAGSKLNHKTPLDNQKPMVRKISATKSAFETKTKIATATMPPPPPLRSKLKPRALKMPPPPKSAAKKALEIKKSDDASNKANGQTVAAKLRNMNSKRLENVKPTKKSPLKRLAQNLKAKKPLNTSKKINVPNVQVNGKQIINLLKTNNQDMVIQTPKDFTLNPFEEFVTSTKLRNSSQNMDNLQGEEGISPIESSPKREPVVKKFNFMRYSEAADNDHNDSDDLEGKVELDGDNKTLVPAAAIEEKTPTKSGPEERPANYLSPFVSVTRGKVSLKREKEKRNSVYLQSPAADNDLPTESNSPKTSPKYSVEVRRTLEAVRYFRQQLQNETDRLHQLCDVWETYKNENLEKIQNANGEDMINVTIGQSRLLTSKKFMQFKGLIDRCEAGATGIGDVENDGSEATKPINSVDLEGFWSMLGLQVDNLEKRFDSLNRWKLNDWSDPDEVKSKPKKNLTKVKKAKAAPAAKAKPNSALQQMLRKMQAEMRKNKNKNNEISGDVVLTPTKQRRSANSNNSTPRKSLDSSSTRRLSIVVKDRKYFSPAATVISVSSPHRRSSILQQKSSQDSPKMLKHIEKFQEALGNIQSPFDLRKSVLMNGNPRRMSFNPQSPMMALDTVAVNGDNDDVPTSSHMVISTESPQRSPVPTGRKSILKTPGTAKSRLRNVIFNEKLRVKKFNFILNEDDSLNGANDANDSHEEDLAQREDEPQRTLTLRNRKVRLRPSCEIVIPSLPPK